MSELGAAKAIWIGAIAAVLPTLAFADSASDEKVEIKDPCDWFEVGMSLKKVWKEDGKFKGLFEVRPMFYKDPATPIVFEGERKAKGFYIGAPPAPVEFLDANGQWRRLFAWGDLISGPSDRLSVPFGKTGDVILSLPDADLAAKASLWKIAIYDVKGEVCVWSVPFRPLQRREPVTGYKSEPVPGWLTEKPQSSPCTSNEASKKQQPEKIRNDVHKKSCAGLQTY